jgi:D-glycero-alpha-D-manno-heptose-7-phosphate kinase
MDSPLVLRATAPTRLDFGGGWTDVPPYADERGGFVCNLAIERRATVTLGASPDHGAPPSPLIAAALDHGGIAGIPAHLASDFPVGAGLGGSSAAGVALAAAVHAWCGIPCTPASLAEWSRSVEVERLGIAGGRQDHYAAALGGALALEFGPEVSARPIPLPATTITELERRCLVFYTGESRISGDTIRAVLEGYLARQAPVVFALDRMASLARLMATALSHGDLDALGALVGEHWQHQRALHPGITTPRIEAVVAAASAAGALGAKPLGASGGGCVAVIAAADRVEAVRAAVTPMATLLDWRVSTDGVRVRTTPPPSA